VDYDSIIHRYQASYYRLPQSVKLFLGTLYGKIPLPYRFGKAYTLHKKILDKFNESSVQYQLDYQFNKTVETLQFAYDHIPYYQSIFREYDFKVDDFKDFSDLRRIPLLTKEIIQKNLDRLYSDHIDKPVPYYTGGSSGQPMKMYAPLSVSRAKEKVYMNYTFRQANHEYRERAVSLSARGNIGKNNNRYWEYQKIDNYLLVSLNHLNHYDIGKIVEEIRRWKPKTFYGYPSAISLFVKSCRTIGIDSMRGVTGVVLTSESISWEDIESIQTFFNATVVSHYGHTERVLSGYRKNKDEYHFFNSYGLVQSKDGELIGTSFDNLVMPYINYSTCDYVSDQYYYNGTDILKSTEYIQGRRQDALVTKENRVIPILNILAGHFASYQNVRRVQFYQKVPGKVTLRIEADREYAVDTNMILQHMRKKVGSSIDFTFQFVDEIRGTQRGKHILCIQELDIDLYKRREKECVE